MATEHEIHKFNEDDRAEVVFFLEKRLKTTLSPMQHSKTFYKDSNNCFHLIIGGSDFWHGIDKEKFKLIEINGFITITVKHKRGYRIYHGEIDKLITNKSSLRDRSKSYQFNIRERSNHLIISEIPDYRLEKIADIRSWKALSEDITDTQIDNLKDLLK
ncbi:MAG TPA: hypothetical protein VEF34_13950 [Syntrophobacteraceae bacterium]|nr:hypothetical protein [Syntrophobacteraceae bacterium]